jgi:hypothetical protein
MGWLDRWLDKREQQRQAELEQLALQIAAQSKRERQRNEEALRELSRAISDEVDRRQAAGELTPLMATEVRLEALKVARAPLGLHSRDTLSPLLTPASVRQLVTDVILASAQERAGAQEQALWLREFKNDAARRERADEGAPGLLARAGIPAGPNELKIATLLLMRDERVTTKQMQQAVKAFEDAYERRVQRYKDTGGQTAWPAAEPLIHLLFGRQ